MERFLIEIVERKGLVHPDTAMPLLDRYIDGEAAYFRQKEEMRSAPI